MSARVPGVWRAAWQRWRGDPDATVRQRPRRRGPGWLLPLALAVAVGLGTAGWIAVRPTHHAGMALRDIAWLDEAGLLQRSVTETQYFRFAAAPRIVVALFPSLHEQAVTLNRIALFVEYGLAPRDRVLDDAALRDTIGAGRQSFDTFYYGHDYRAADIARFFATADTDGVMLNGAEIALRRRLAGLAAAGPGFGALISLGPEGPAPQDPLGRAAILRHEISHGVYFTDPVYARCVQLFWMQTLTAEERDGFRRFLGGNGYDAGNDDLIRNEMQAYLVHTRDRRFFYPGAAGLTPDRATTLRAAFVAAMPAGWLRDHTAP